LPWRITETTAQSVNGYLLNGPSHTAPGVLVAALVLLGAVLCLRQWRAMWIPLVYALAVTVDVVTATSHSPQVLHVTRLWYGDRNRTAGVVPIGGVLLAVAGASTLWKAAADRSRTAVRGSGRAGRRTATTAGLAGLMALAVNLPAHAAYLDQSLAGRSTDPADSLVSPAQVALYEQLPSRVPPHDYILNDPRDGSAFLYAYSGRQPTYLSGTTATPAKNADYLRSHLVFDHDHPRVCSMLKHDHIAWILNVRRWSAKPPVGRQSARGMLVPPGFWLTTPVAKAGTTTLFKVTGCPRG
jgi:hypothetical protein